MRTKVRRGPPSPCSQRLLTAVHLHSAEPAATASPVPAAAAGSDEEADIDKKPLSKKEKERLKKEREKVGSDTLDNNDITETMIS